MPQVSEAQITNLWTHLKAAKRAVLVEDPPNEQTAGAEFEEMETMLRALCPPCEPDDPE